MCTYMIGRDVLFEVEIMQGKSVAEACCQCPLNVGLIKYRIHDILDSCSGFDILSKDVSFTWHFTLNGKIDFGLTISYQKPFLCPRIG